MMTGHTMNSTDSTFPELRRYQRKASIVGAVGLAVTILGAAAAGGFELFFQSYLLGFIVVLGLGLGSLGLLMLHHLVGGAWGFIIQRILEAGSRTLPFIALFFLPIAFFGMESLYSEWLHPDPADEVILAKAGYLNESFFMMRAVAYFAIWFLLAYFFNKWSRQLDETGDPRITVWLHRLGPVGIILYFLTLTFCSVDWVMSLEPAWFSTMYGPLFLVSQVLTVLSFSVIVLSYMDGRKPLSDVTNIEYYHHLGNLILAFTVLWTYMSFAQYLITWAGNLPEEIIYYLPRRGGLLSLIAVVLMVGHFAVPFMCLLFRHMKRNVSMLRKVAYWILIMRIVDLTWFIKPAFHDGSTPYGGVMDFVTDMSAIAGLGGLWMAVFFWQLRRRPLLPKNDPRMDNAFGRVEMMEHA